MKPVRSACVSVVIVALVGCSADPNRLVQPTTNAPAGPKLVVYPDECSPDEYCPDPTPGGNNLPPEWHSQPGLEGYGDQAYIQGAYTFVSFSGSSGTGVSGMWYWGTSWSQTMTLEIYDQGVAQSPKSWKAEGSAYRPVSGVFKLPGSIPIAKNCGLALTGKTEHDVSIYAISRSQITSNAVPDRQGLCPDQPPPPSDGGGGGWAGAGEMCWYITRINADTGEVISEKFIAGPEDCPR
jgi:hypothetical protein